MLVSDYSSLFMAFSFAGGGGSVCPGAVLDFFPGMGRVAMSGVQCLPICSAVSRRLLWSQLAGRNGMVVFS
jgi:hypothetical protein